jgi:hypothetical protein
MIGSRRWDGGFFDHVYMLFFDRSCVAKQLYSLFSRGNYGVMILGGLSKKMLIRRGR